LDDYFYEFYEVLPWYFIRLHLEWISIIKLWSLELTPKDMEYSHIEYSQQVKLC
jgi:hypothetical protein